MLSPLPGYERDMVDDTTEIASRRHLLNQTTGPGPYY